MARKTFHHLKDGDKVLIENTLWENDLTLTVLSTVEGEVTYVTAKQVRIRFPRGNGGFETWANFSRQGGQVWGASDNNGFRISPTMARAKEVSK